MTQHEERQRQGQYTTRAQAPPRQPLSPQPRLYGREGSAKSPTKSPVSRLVARFLFLPVMSSVLSKRRAVLYRRVVINQVLSSSFLSALPSRGLRDWRQEAPNAMKERHQGENLRHSHGALEASRKGLLF